MSNLSVVQDAFDTLSPPEMRGPQANMYSLIGAPSSLSEPIMYGISATEKLVADFHQYIVCIRNSEATEPLNDEYD